MPDVVNQLLATEVALDKLGARGISSAGRVLVGPPAGKASVGARTQGILTPSASVVEITTLGMGSEGILGTGMLGTGILGTGMLGSFTGALVGGSGSFGVSLTGGDAGGLVGGAVGGGAGTGELVVGGVGGAVATGSLTRVVMPVGAGLLGVPVAFWMDTGVARGTCATGMRTVPWVWRGLGWVG